MNLHHLIKGFCLSFLILFCTTLQGMPPNYAPETISIDALENFSANPPKVKKAIIMGLDLAGRHLGYKYGSADPHFGGMDCSGTIYYLLTQLGVPLEGRSSHDMYQWLKKSGHFYTTHSPTFDSKDFSQLKPGDLLFWSGTYNAPQNVYATHVMMYIGRNKQGQHLMMGASDGRTYKGRKIYGVSVFDFILPPPNSKSKFLGYSCIPQINCK